MAAPLNLVGDFVNPWSNPTEEAIHIEDWTWAPGSDTWHAVCGTNTTTVSSVSQFLGVIKKQTSGSIERLNLFSHGNPGLLAFTGKIDRSSGAVVLDVKSGLDLRIRDLTTPIEGQETYGTIALKLQDRFRPKAKMVMYLCNSGSDAKLLQAIANAFGVEVGGFQGSVYFCPEWPLGQKPPRINRSFTSLDKCAHKKAGFAHLNPTITCMPAVVKP
jgi:hypothetical protein